MTGEQPFVDYYDVLQVDPGCDDKTLEAAYHDLAKLHHPDHSGAEDTTRFNEVTQAYRALRSPEKRAEYDRLHVKFGRQSSYRHTSNDDLNIEEKGALNDADDHSRILVYLYRKRRVDPNNAGVVPFYIQQILQCSDEHFEFHKWYLKEKGFIVTTEQGTIAITIQGVDHVISMSRTAEEQRLLTARTADTGEGP